MTFLEALRTVRNIERVNLTWPVKGMPGDELDELENELIQILEDCQEVLAFIKKVKKRRQNI